MATTVQLPGVSFQTVTRQPPDTLPRMDIAAFVGFAAAGPLHTPVAVEDLGRFRDVFGADLPLAWDEERGRNETAQLGPSVEAFFRNGGRRCWVVRVADEGSAFTYHFAIPGLVTADDGGLPALADARSEGTWPRELRVGTILDKVRFLESAQKRSVFQPVNYEIDLVASPKEIRAGDLLELRFSAGELIAYLFVESAEVEDNGLRVLGSAAHWFDGRAGNGGSPPPDEDEEPELIPLSEIEGLALADALLSGSPEASLSIWRLNFQILVWQGSQIRHRLLDLAFHKAHPRFWGNLPSDAELFQQDSGRRVKIRPEDEDLLRAEAADPRFPLAPGEDVAASYLPLRMLALPDSEVAVGPVDEPSGGDLEANGLAAFEPSLFLDSSLEIETWGSVLNEARNKYYVRQLPLRGIHSLLPIEEVSMVAAPDLIHRGWGKQAPPGAKVFPAPYLNPIPDPDEDETYHITWTAVEGATGYCLERAPTTCFGKAVAAYEGPDAEAVIALPGDCRGEVFFRVRAHRYSERSPWSNTRGRLLPPESFEKCGLIPAGIVELSLQEGLAGSPDEGIELFWTVDATGAQGIPDRFELQSAGNANFAFPETFSISDDMSHLVEEPVDGVRFYRVRGRAGNRKGTWSNTIALFPSTRRSWTLLPEEEYDLSVDDVAPSPRDTLLAVHRALIRFCAGRADMVAVLGLPRHFRRDEVLGHLSALLPQQKPVLNQIPEAPRTRVPKFTLGESPAFSYSALYHPWVAVTNRSSEQTEPQTEAARFLPPEGPVCGFTAARTIFEGAWVAPANIPIHGGLALDPYFEIEQWAELTAAQVNLIVDDPRGFLVINSETLGRENEFRQLNVRRLMILLRRLAFRYGVTYVFEPNSADFRDRVRDRFERLLSRLYVRGAFAGASAEEGFRVVADDTINTRQSIEAGRFIVELRVAPSKPLQFLNVRLAQSGPEQLTVEEI